MPARLQERPLRCPARTPGCGGGRGSAPLPGAGRAFRPEQKQAYLISPPAEENPEGLAWTVIRLRRDSGSSRKRSSLIL